jgi:hypothetical protein
VLVIVAVFAVALVVASRRTPEVPKSEDALAQPVAVAPAPPAVKPVAKVAMSASPKASTQPAAVPVVAATKESGESDTESPVTPAVSAVSAAVTIDGCLERADNGFRLKDTTGADAPKSRSWKSGFLRKGSVPVRIVDAANGLRLASHLGERVSVTGTMIDREMRAHAVRSLAASCK